MTQTSPVRTSLVRPRLTDYYDIHAPQAATDFAIPFFNEDLPLYVDPFLLWKSPSMQDQALHTSIMDAFNELGHRARNGGEAEAGRILAELTECDEVGLGASRTRQGRRLGQGAVGKVLDLFKNVPRYRADGMRHLEELQLFVEGISKDRVSDLACNFLKSFLIDYTIQECGSLGVPLGKVKLRSLYDTRTSKLQSEVEVDLPVHPETGAPLIVVPKRWLRHVPWISFEDYYKHHAPKDDAVHGKTPDERVRILTFNRQNYGAVETYIKARELAAGDCFNDPLFRQIPVRSARSKLEEIGRLPTGNTAKADKLYEDRVVELLSTVLYPKLDLAGAQSRTADGVSIRDLIMYNTAAEPFLAEILSTYGSRQLVFELKNARSRRNDEPRRSRILREDGWPAQGDA